MREEGWEALVRLSHGDSPLGLLDTVGEKVLKVVHSMPHHLHSGGGDLENRTLSGSNVICW